MFERGAGFSAGVDADDVRARGAEEGWGGAGRSAAGGGVMGPAAACARDWLGAAAQSTPSKPQKISEDLLEGNELLGTREKCFE